MKKLLLGGFIAALAIATTISTSAVHAGPVPQLPPCGASIAIPPTSPYMFVQCEAYYNETTGHHYDALYYDLSGVPIIN